MEVFFRRLNPYFVYRLSVIDNLITLSATTDYVSCRSKLGQFRIGKLVLSLLSEIHSDLSFISQNTATLEKSKQHTIQFLKIDRNSNGYHPLTLSPKACWGRSSWYKIWKFYNNWFVLQFLFISSKVK